MTEIVRPVTLIESPFSAPTREGIVRNVYYAMLAARDSLTRGEAPYASHLFFTQILNDNDPAERMLGIDVGLTIGRLTAQTALYIDMGVSRGMQYGVAAAQEAGRPIVERTLFAASDIDSVIEQHVAQHNLPSPDVIGALYARIIT